MTSEAILSLFRGKKILVERNTRIYIGTLADYDAAFILLKDVSVYDDVEYIENIITGKEKSPGKFGKIALKREELFYIFEPKDYESKRIKNCKYLKNKS